MATTFAHGRQRRKVMAKVKVKLNKGETMEELD